MGHKWAIFHSYVTSPEGKWWFTSDLWVDPMGPWWKTHSNSWDLWMIYGCPSMKKNGSVLTTSNPMTGRGICYPIRCSSTHPGYSSNVNREEPMGEKSKNHSTLQEPRESIFASCCWISKPFLYCVQVLPSFIHVSNLCTPQKETHKSGTACFGYVDVVCLLFQTGVPFQPNASWKGQSIYVILCFRDKCSRSDLQKISTIVRRLLQFVHLWFKPSPMTLGIPAIHEQNPNFSPETCHATVALTAGSCCGVGFKCAVDQQTPVYPKWVLARCR